MKKIIFSLLLFSLLMPCVLALSVDIKENYQPRETILVKISGNFLENIKPENILFYSGRLSVPMEYDLGKIDNSFYLYAVLPNKERNYTLKINKVHYFEAGQDKTQNFEYNFTVSGKIADFTIKPGFVVSSKDFSITLESNTEDLDISIKYSTFSTDVQVQAGTSKIIPISLLPLKDMVFLEASTSGMAYKIPVKSMAQEVIKRSISFSKPIYNFSLFRGSETHHNIYILNTGDEEITDVKVTSSKPLDIVPVNISSIKPNSFAELNLTIIPDQQETITLSAKAEGVSADTVIQINPILITVENLTESEIPTYLCRELGYTCTEKQSCEGYEKKTLDNDKCCMGECKNKFSFLTFFIVLVILAAAAGAGYYFWKFKKKKFLPESFKSSAAARLLQIKK